jgi:hypothetical protein
MHRFIPDGYDNARAVFEDELIAEVTAEFAEEFAAAAWWRRLWLRRKIRREALSRLHRVVPPNACY